MIIGIDATPAFKPNRTGVELYCYEIIKSLMNLDKDNEYRLYVKSIPAENFPLEFNFKFVVLKDQHLWTHTALFSELLKNPVDTFYSPGHVMPIFSNTRTVFTIHDAGFRHHRNNYSLYQFIHAQINTYISIKTASHTIAISNFVGDDVQNYYSINTDKYTVVHNGFRADDYTDDKAPDIKSAREKYKIADGYFIYIGRLEARKNLVRVIEAFSDLVDEGQDPGQLVLLGSKAQGFDDIQKVINERGCGSRIVAPGYVSVSEKLALLKGARALVFPTLYEGFGVPILEGFAAGTPVITSSTTACPEIAGGAALLVNPRSVKEIKDAMLRLWSEKPLREECRRRGLVRCRDFDWYITAQNIHEILVS